MKGFKCFGLLLLLSIMVGLSLNASSDVSALKHEYNGITPISWNVACLKVNQNNIVYYDYINCTDYFTFGVSAFSVGLFGDSWPSDFDEATDISPKISQSSFYCDEWSDTDTTCTISSPHSNFSLFDDDDDESNGVGYTFSIGSLYGVFQDSVIPGPGTGFAGKYSKLRTLEASGVTTDLVHLDDYTRYPSSPYYPNIGALSGYHERTYVSDNILPYWYSADGFYIHSKAINPDNGITYSNTFSLSDMYDYDFPKFSLLQIPFTTNNNYWFTPSNLRSGRSIEFAGTFEFDGSFSWNPYAVEHGVFELRYNYVPEQSDGYGSYDNSLSGSVSCTTNLITVETLTRLEWSCPVILPEDMVYFQPYLVIAGEDDAYPSHYVWETDDVWRFGSCYIVTDNDSTLGSSFNDNLTGGGDIIGDASNNFPSGSEDWFYSLTHLFNFTMLNPFTPIFALFTNQSTCANIPTIANMLHSNETQVCPWFSAETRAIVTPVVGIVSTMLVFGFAVRWLGSRSGNFMEDSDSHEIGSIRVGRKGRK